MPMFMIFLYSSLCHHNKNEVLVLNVIMICFLVYVLVNKVHNEKSVQIFLILCSTFLKKEKRNSDGYRFIWEPDLQ